MLLLALAARVAVGADTGGLLRNAEDDYRGHLLRARPDLASRYGLRAADGRLAPVTEATLRSDSAWLEHFTGRLDAVDRGALTPREGERFDTLLARVERERAPHASGAWRRDPALYLELGPGSVLAAATEPGTSTCGRMKNVVKRLRALPEVLRAARVTLRDSAGPDSEAAPWRAAMDSLRVLPARLSACREPVREADLVEADTLALAACERFIRFLREERGVAVAPGGRRD